jgi:hypothetical protein
MPQGTSPVADSGQWLGLAACVEKEKGDCGVAEVQLVHDTVSRLAGEIPQQNLALSVLLGFGFSGGHPPDAPGVRRFGRAELLAGHYQCHAGLADARVAEEQYLRIRIAAHRTRLAAG